MMIVPKSGWPVLGQTAVNSGHVISISYWRLRNWLGNASTAAGMFSPPKPHSNPRSKPTGRTRSQARPTMERGRGEPGVAHRVSRLTAGHAEPDRTEPRHY